MDTSLRHTPPGFERGRTHIAEGLMHSLAIVKHLDKLKDLAPGFVPCLERAVMDQLVLQRAEEALGHRVIVTVASATHAGHQPMLSQDLPIGRRRILAALLRA